MSYTVNEVAKLSGVSIRTLRYYDEIGLLKPAYVQDNNYRYYKEKQLLILQQILFFKELGFTLKQIQNILQQSDFDRLEALHSHSKEILTRIKRLKKLSITINKTINHLEGKQAMKEKEIYYGFNNKHHQNHMQKIEMYFNKHEKESLESFRKNAQESRKNVKNWSHENWKKSNKEFDLICIKLVDLMKQKVGFDDKKVQDLVNRHFQWLSKFWVPNKKTYSRYARIIKASELRSMFDKYNPKLSEFLSEAIKLYVDKNL